MRNIQLFGTHRQQDIGIVRCECVDRGYFCDELIWPAVQGGWIVGDFEIVEIIGTVLRETGKNVGSRESRLWAGEAEGLACQSAGPTNQSTFSEGPYGDSSRKLCNPLDSAAFICTAAIDHLQYKDDGPSCFQCISGWPEKWRIPEGT